MSKLVKTAELTGAALDWAVAKALGEHKPVAVPHFSTDWSEGGPIIERTCASVFVDRKHAASEGHPEDYWFCEISEGGLWHGSTLLIAAMRCYVASKMGDEVGIPKELA